MDSVASISSADFGGIVAFVASSLFGKAFVAHEATQDESWQTKVQSLTCGVELVLAGEQGKILRARYDRASALALLDQVAPQLAGSQAAAADSAVGELLNVIAGQLKSQLAWPLTLGLPRPAQQGQQSASRPSAQDACVWLTNGGQRQRVLVQLSDYQHGA